MKKNTLIIILGVVLILSGSPIYARSAEATVAYLNGCVYLPVTPDTPITFTFTHVGEYCMEDPDSVRKDSKSLTFTVSKQGLNCSDDIPNQEALRSTYTYWPSIYFGSCLTNTSKSLVFFNGNDTQYTSGAYLMWGGSNAKSSRFNQVYYEDNTEKIRICSAKTLCSTKSGDDHTIYYSKQQNLYVIYSPLGN